MSNSRNADLSKRSTSIGANSFGHATRGEDHAKPQFPSSPAGVGADYTGVMSNEEALQYFLIGITSDRETDGSLVASPQWLD